jgi:putative Mn2+ efflux pump MntP
LNVTIFFPAVIIGIVALITTAIGLHVGRKISEFSHLQMYAEILGGIVLLLIGLNILREHGALPFP